MKKIMVVLLVIYAIIVFRLLFVNVGSTNRSEYFTQNEVKIIPFQNTIKSIKEGYRNDYGPNKTHLNHYRYLAFRNIAGNLMLFFPWGMIAPILIPRLRSVKKLMLVTAVISMLAEITQFILVIGVFDIDDILLNTTGAALGCILVLKIRSKYTSTS